jgi:NAD(P)-dependent dehydrogenase (short-subunit alcohol dehydrogenase family)
VSSDAAFNAYPRWGAYAASKAALHHMTGVWAQELKSEGVRFVSFDPGDMDTDLHRAAVPDADPASLKRPEIAVRQMADTLASALVKAPGTAEARPGALVR